MSIPANVTVQIGARIMHLRLYLLLFTYPLLSYKLFHSTTAPRNGIRYDGGTVLDASWVLNVIDLGLNLEKASGRCSHT